MTAIRGGSEGVDATKYRFGNMVPRCSARQTDRPRARVAGFHEHEAVEIRAHVRGACPELAYLQDICIESKHAEIARYTPRIDEARVHVGAFSRGFSNDFDTSRLEIVLSGGRKVLFNDVVDRAVEFWSTFLEAHGLG